jgi:hypothetical protein
MAEPVRRTFGASVLVAVLALPAVPHAAGAQTASPTLVTVDQSTFVVDDVMPPVSIAGAEAVVRQQDLETFVTIGASYRSASVEDGRVRAHTTAGWTDWFDLHGATGGGDGPGPGSPEAGHAPPASDPIWVGEADGYELSLPADASAVRVHLVRPTGEAAPVSPAAPTESTAGAAPTVRMREAWGARPYRGTVRLNANLRRGLIHHTVNSNSYSQSQVPSMLRSIQAFHQDTRGWADIAYNFVVDRFGTLWEARARSYEDPVIGSASSGDATGNVTVAYLGDGSTVTPPAAVTRSMGRLLGWKLRKHGLTPTRANIMGHRDIGQTSCPGNALYARIGAVEDVAIVPPGPFRDVPWSNPQAQAIDWAARNDLIGGFADGRFRPGRDASRGDAALWLWRFAGSPTGAFTEPFTDVGPGDPFLRAVRWGSTTGVLRGVSATRFAPGRVMTRQGFIDSLWRLLGEPAVAVPHPFTDAGPRDSFDWAAEFGLVEGTRVRGTDPLDRGPAAGFLYRTRPFTDVGRNSVNRAAVDWGRAHVIVAGYADHTFRPTPAVTRKAAADWVWRFLDRPPPGPVDATPGATPLRRSVAVTWLWQAAGSPTVDVPSGYGDVTPGAAHEMAAAWAEDFNLFPDVPPPTFDATHTVSRAQFVRALYRLAQRPGAWAVTPPGTVLF